MLTIVRVRRSFAFATWGPTTVFFCGLLLSSGCSHDVALGEYVAPSGDDKSGDAGGANEPAIGGSSNHPGKGTGGLHEPDDDAGDDDASGGKPGTDASGGAAADDDASGEGEDDDVLPPRP